MYVRIHSDAFLAAHWYLQCVQEYIKLSPLCVGCFKTQGTCKATVGYVQEAKVGAGWQLLLPEILHRYTRGCSECIKHHNVSSAVLRLCTDDKKADKFFTNALPNHECTLYSRQLYAMQAHTFVCVCVCTCGLSRLW